MAQRKSAVVATFLLGVVLSLLPAARDPLQVARDRIRSCDERERARLIANSDRFYALSPLRQSEIRDLVAKLESSPSDVREELERTMSRLASIVDASPKEQRAKYLNADLDSERMTALQEMIRAQAAEEQALVAKLVPLSDGMRRMLPALGQLALQANPKGPPRERSTQKGFNKGQRLFLQPFRERLGKLSDPDDRKLQDLLESNETHPFDRFLIVLCLLERNPDPRGKHELTLFYDNTDWIAGYERLFQRVQNVFPRLGFKESFRDLSEAERREFWNALADVYLLEANSKIPAKDLKLPIVLRGDATLKKGKMAAAQPMLYRKLELLYKYKSDPSLVPAGDADRVKRLLEGTSK